MNQLQKLTRPRRHSKFSRKISNWNIISENYNPTAIINTNPKNSLASHEDLLVDYLLIWTEHLRCSARKDEHCSICHSPPSLEKIQIPNHVILTLYVNLLITSHWPQVATENQVLAQSFAVSSGRQYNLDTFMKLGRKTMTNLLPASF